MILVSACLAGVECRYDGSSFPIPEVVEMVRRGEAIPICPELLAGLPIPRPPAEHRDGKIVSKNGQDFTADYLSGAKIGAEIAQLIACKKAILKSRSPSCGSGWIYDGTFSGVRIQGNGVFAKMLKDNNVIVFTEESFL